MRSRSSSPVILAALALSAAACTSGSTTTLSDTTYTSTAIFVRPAQFLGDTPCSAAPGAMRSYVATLVDRTYSEICGNGACEPHESGETCARDCGALPSCGDGACGKERDKDGADTGKDETIETCPVDCGGTVPSAFTLPSSLPTSCSQGVRFDNVVVGHRYSVHIDGYEAFADEICPDGCIIESGANRGKVDLRAMRSGSRHMQLAEPGGAPVEPRWLGGCGNGDQPRTIPAGGGTTLIVDCGPLVDTAETPGITAVELSPQDTLGELACATPCLTDSECSNGLCDHTTGQCDSTVARFDIEAPPGIGDVLGVPCGTPFVQTYSGDKLKPGEPITFFISAHEQPDGPVTWGAQCTAVAQSGLTVRAACAPLSDKGSLRIDIASVLGLFGVKECSGDITAYEADLPAHGLFGATVPCTADTTFGPLAPGEYTAEVVIYTKDQNDLFSASCTGAVTPGRATVAACQLK